jgi:hypothetical protein
MGAMVATILDFITDSNTTGIIEPIEARFYSFQGLEI